MPCVLGTMNSKKSMPVGALLIISVAMIPSVISAPSHAAQDCESAIADAGRRITDTGAQVFRLEDTAITGYALPDAFKDHGARELSISLGNIVTSVDKSQSRKGEQIMASPVLKMSLAQSILSSCANYQSFTIKVWGTDWSSQYFKMPSGAIREGSCVPPGGSGGNDLMWGYKVCY